MLDIIAMVIDLVNYNCEGRAKGAESFLRLSIIKSLWRVRKHTNKHLIQQSVLLLNIVAAILDAHNPTFSEKLTNTSGFQETLSRFPISGLRDIGEARTVTGIILRSVRNLSE
jgi:hypothetical protein